MKLYKVFQHKITKEFAFFYDGKLMTSDTPTLFPLNATMKETKDFFKANKMEVDLDPFVLKTVQMIVK